MTNLSENKIFTHTFFLIVLAELLSFLGYYYSAINSLAFFIIVILTILISLYRLEYGLYILLTELVIGSFGYLFYLDINGMQISLRLGLWLAIMSVWLAKTVLEWLKNKNLTIDFLKFGSAAPLVCLLIFVGWGLANGLVNGNSLSNIFFDANNWFYFLLIFPVSAVWRNNDQLETLKPILLAAITWLSAKTILLAYVFTHNFHGLNLEIYGWMRADRLGEITQTAAGFSRIFMQSQLFVLIGFFILLFYLLKTIVERNNLITSWRDLSKDICLLALFLSAIIISFSRSFWLGLVAGGIFIWLIALFRIKIKFKQFIIYNSIILFSLILSLILTLAAVKFPYPDPYGGFNPADLLSQRASQITNEAGVASRWQLLEPLWQEIKTAPVLGRGFGATVTYKTNDPRILASNPDGLYTAYSFEWGWLGIWLKLGLFGLLTYLILLIKIVQDGLKINSSLSLSLISGLIVLMTVNIFSPYLNHPLGIGYIIMVMALYEK
ncbi:MAG: hypothetical protein UU95_C0030G0017 [Parcubacteria group bacterium GW2011_GWC2_42_12]|nr:MAG: hypothetical protein UU95_C0030G0017 [Parcubacteria group bacterium GW2011_GWC2_42_12]